MLGPEDDNEFEERSNLLDSSQSKPRASSPMSICRAFSTVVGGVLGFTLLVFVVQHYAQVDSGGTRLKRWPHFFATAPPPSPSPLPPFLSPSSPPPPSPPPLGPAPVISLTPYRNILIESSSWVEATAPHFECSDADITTTYWYRWRLFHVHMSRRPAGAAGCGKAGGCWVITEFLKRVWWAGPHNTIVCPAGHHIMEGRWLRDSSIIDDYARFWFRGDGHRKQYTWWAAFALWQRSLLLRHSAGEGVQAELFSSLDAHYHDWLRTHYLSASGCMFTPCHADGQENSAGLDGCRPTINSVMHGESLALSHIALALGNTTRAAYFKNEAARWSAVLTSQLWSPQLGFFVNVAQRPPKGLRWRKMGDPSTTMGCLRCDAKRTCPPKQGWPLGRRVSVRELMGLSSPWYFYAVPSGKEGSKRGAAAYLRYARAFEQLEDPKGFGARYGPRTTERRSACHNFSTAEQCNWNGASWPFETSKVGTALINLLQTYPPQATAGRPMFDRLLTTYARAHTRTSAEGLPPPHVDEDLHPDDGYWITRRKLHGIRPWKAAGGIGRPKGADPLARRGDHYFHSTFNDLVLSGLVGLRAHDAFLEIYPLGLVEHFCATRLLLRGVEMAVVWDARGMRYPHGAGIHVWMDGKPLGSVPPEVHERDGKVVLTPPRLQVSWTGRSLVACSALPATPEINNNSSKNNKACREILANIIREELETF